MFKFPTLFGMKKEPLFDDHQIRKTKKPNTTEKGCSKVFKKPCTRPVRILTTALSYTKKIEGFHVDTKLY